MFTFICIHQAGSNINNDNNNRKLNYKHLIKYYNLLQNWQKSFTVEIYCNINLSCLLFYKHSWADQQQSSSYNLLLRQYRNGTTRRPRFGAANSAPPTRRRDNSAQGQLDAGDSAPGHFGAASVKVHYKSQPNAKTQSKDKNSKTG